MEVTCFPCTASEKTKEIGSEKTKEPVYSITKSDSENSETGGIREKFVDYTESSELEDETSENCQINVDRDFNTDHHNIKDPMIGGKLLPVDTQPSSDYDEQEKIPVSKLAMLEGNLEEMINSEELFFSDYENRSNSIVDDIISELNIKDPLVAKSMEPYCLTIQINC